MTDEIKMKAIEWLLGRDTGISSKTMCGALVGIKPAWRDVPYDPADFGRCLRFIRFMPGGTKDIVFKNLANDPVWAEIGKRWDELESLFDNQKWEQVYDILTNIREEFRPKKANEIFIKVGQ